MNMSIEVLLALFQLTGLMLAASSRLLHCIRIVALQGLLLGILPWLFHDNPAWELAGASLLNIAVKGITMPLLLLYAMRKANVGRELEPLVGYGTSIGIVLCVFLFSFWLGEKLPLPEAGARLFMPAAFSTMLTGLFIVMSRRKALTQVIGFLVFENGISLFASGLMLELGLTVELGIMLDVLVLVFIMGIAMMGINNTFKHIDADRLNMLGDVNMPGEEH